MIFMPPRHGKSELASRLFTAYYLYRHPERWVGINSYGAGLSYTFSRSARDNYREAGGTLRHDAKAVKQWETGRGGGLWAAGAGGDITGKGFHLGLIDDPLKNADEAESAPRRRKLQEWYQSTFYTREEPGGAIVIILTRWNESDLAGWQLAEEAEGEEPEHWHIVSFAAIKENPGEEPAFPATCTVEPDWRQPGEALCPERASVERLRKIAKKVGSYFWSAMFQQSPRPREGILFKEPWFQTVRAAPAKLRMVRYWDLAASPDGDYTVGTLMGYDRASTHFYVLDVQRGRWTPKERNRIILETARSDGRAVRIYLEEEGGSGGKAQTTQLRTILRGFTVLAKKSTGNKVVRASPFSAQMEGGNVFILQPEDKDGRSATTWQKDFKDELIVFPTGVHDDQVDSASGAFNALTRINTASRHLVKVS